MVKDHVYLTSKFVEGRACQSFESLLFELFIFKTWIHEIKLFIYDFDCKSTPIIIFTERVI